MGGNLDEVHQINGTSDGLGRGILGATRDPAVFHPRHTSAICGGISTLRSSAPLLSSIPSAYNLGIKQIGDMGVSKNRGTPKWMVYWGIPICQRVLHPPAASLKKRREFGQVAIGITLSKLLWRFQKGFP